MRILQSRVLWGVLLILAGVLFLVESLNLIKFGSAWAVLFAAAGLGFGYAFLEDRSRWWAIIPAMALLGIAGLVGLDAWLPGEVGPWGGTLFLGSLGLAFLIIYFATHREQWWALIPAGVLVTLATTVGLEPILPDEAFVGLFFLGLGLTFALVYVLARRDQGLRWALIPAGILGLMGVIFLSLAGRLATIVWPVVLIVVGGYVLLRSARR